MSKYSFEEKYEAVQRVLDGMSIHESARIMGVSFAQVQRWFHLYENHGWEALKKGGASYDGTFKVMVVEYMHSNHLSYVSTAAYFGINGDAHVAKWERIYYEEGPEGLLRKKPRGRPPKCMRYTGPIINTTANLKPVCNSHSVFSIYACIHIVSNFFNHSSFH